MEIIINEGKLQASEINEINNKVRALLVTDDDCLLVANYNGVFLLPGGSLNKGENIEDGIVRELLEETGKNYCASDFSYFTSVKYFQKNYPKRNGTFINRLVNTYYFLAQYKGLSLEHQQLSQNERDGKFSLSLISIEELEQLLSKEASNNPRSSFFKKELLSIIQLLKSKKDIIPVKTKIKD